MPELRTLLIGDDPGPWAAAGFAVDGDRTTIGSITIRFVTTPGGSPQRGVIGWELTDIDDGSIDGIMSIGTDAAPAEPVTHPNRVTRMDHVVVMTPDLERTTASLRGFGFSPRRTRDVPGSEPARRQTFFWAGETILEVVGPVESTGSAPASIWGLALTTDDMDAATNAIGGALTAPKPAVQPGRHIATVKTKDLDISTAIALMTAHVADDAPPPHDRVEG
jgi:catechol 2,3-dioxygenase-like lactoylglutathione lyase family enzyme